MYYLVRFFPLSCVVVWIACFHIKENEVTGQGDELGGWDGCQASFY